MRPNNEVNYVGMRFHHEKYGWYEIIEDLGLNFTSPSGKKVRKVKVRFDNTGYTAIVHPSSALQIGVKDPYYPLVCGVGCMGEPVDYDYKRDSKIYQAWNAMIARCYDPTNHNYETYGAKGITVCDRWKCFANYIEDVRKFDNFDIWLNNRQYEIDKDLLQQDKPMDQRVYSPETCCIIPKDYNTSLMHKDNHTRPDKQYVGVVQYEPNKYRCRFYKKSDESLNSKCDDVIFDNPYYAAIYHDTLARANGRIPINNVPLDPKSIYEAQSHRSTTKKYTQLYHLVDKDKD